MSGEVLTDEIFLTLARRWRVLGVGYSAPEVIGTGHAASPGFFDPEQTILDTLPYLLYDGHMFGLVLACLETFSDLIDPARLGELFRQKYPEPLQRPDSPATTRGALAGSEYASLRSVLTLAALAAKLQRVSAAWADTGKLARGLTPAWLPGDLAEGRLRLWGAERDKDLRMIIKSYGGDVDEELADVGLRFPVTTAAPRKKLRSREAVVAENPVYQSRLEKKGT